jgi:hypothetical protein
MSGDRISDEAVLAARVAFDEAYNSDGVSWANAMRSAIAAALPLLEGGKGEPVWLRDFLSAKMHHLPVEDQHVLSVILDADPQPAAPQPAEPVAGGAVDARIADLSALRSSVQSMRDRMMRLLPEHFGDGFDGDYDTMLEVIIWIKSAIAALRANTEKSK